MRSLPRAALVACLVFVCSQAFGLDSTSKPDPCASLRARGQISPDALRTIDRQCERVARADISPRVLAFFATVPIVWDGPGDPALSRYDGAAGVVHLRGKDTDRPILLHELMHAFHHRQLEGSWRNTEVADLFAQAQAGRLFPAGSFLLSNEVEYFAVAATVFANGSAARVPRTREELCDRQPAACDYLRRVLQMPQ